MSTFRTNIHPGWTKSEDLDDDNASTHKFRRTEGALRYEAGPLEIWCGPKKVTEEEWDNIEAWIKHNVPRPGYRLQAFFTICECEMSASRPVQLKLVNETTGFSKEQRERVSLRRHDHNNQPVRISILLRQILRPT